MIRHEPAPEQSQRAGDRVTTHALPPARLDGIRQDETISTGLLYLQHSFERSFPTHDHRARPQTMFQKPELESPFEQLTAKDERGAARDRLVRKLQEV